jgi:hypothetical protein
MRFFGEDIPTLSAWIPRSARATCPERSRVVAPQSWRKLSMRIPKAMVDRRRGKRGEGSKKWEGEVTTGMAEIRFDESPGSSYQNRMIWL